MSYLVEVQDSTRLGGQLSEDEWRRNRSIVVTTVGLVFGGFTMVISFLPLYLQDLGVTDVALNASYSGAIISVAPLLAALGGPMWGKLADRRGLKPIALRVTLAFVIGWVLFGTATHVWHLVLARVIVGLSGGYNAICVPLAIAGCPPGRLSRTIGTIQSTRTASIALGPLVGGLLAGLVGIRATAYLASTLFLLAFGLLYFFYREDPSAGRGVADNLSPPLKIRQLFTSRELAPLIGVLFVTAFIDRIFSPIIPLLVLSFGTAQGNTAWISGMIFSVAAFASTFSALGAGKLGARYDPVWILRILIGGSVLAAAPLVWAESNLALGAYRAGLGCMAGGILTVVYVLGDRWIPGRSRATGNAVLSSALLMGYALGPLLGGLLAGFGLRVVLGVCCPAFLVLFPLVWWTVPTSRA